MSSKHVPLVTRLLPLSDPRHCTDGSFRLFNRGLLGSCSFSIPFALLLFLFFLPLALHFLCQVTLQEPPPDADDSRVHPHRPLHLPRRLTSSTWGPHCNHRRLTFHTISYFLDLLFEKIVSVRVKQVFPGRVSGALRWRGAGCSEHVHLCTESRATLGAWAVLALWLFPASE